MPKAKNVKPADKAADKAADPKPDTSVASTELTRAAPSRNAKG